jgi:dihydroneopterin aldolase
MQEYQVGLEDVRFFGYHGLFPEERILGNWFVLRVQVGKHLDSFAFENIDQTFDYGIIYNICKEVMDEPVDLLETVAARIAIRLKKALKGISSYEIHVWKERPPLGLVSGKSRVSIIERF